MNSNKFCGFPKYFLWLDSPKWDRASLSRFRDHTQTRHTRHDSSGRVISPSQRPLPNNTQHSQQTDVHAPKGNRNYNPKKRAATDPRLRPRCCWDSIWLVTVTNHTAYQLFYLHSVQTESSSVVI
jgi:hypothetical protein